MFQSILVPLDGSELAERAISVAVHIARVAGAKLNLLRVIATGADFRWDYIDVANADPSHLEAHCQQANAYLKALATSQELTGVSASYEVTVGSPANAILARAEKHEADLIVMCSHGENRLARWVLGSVAHKVAHHSPVPVLILREHEEDHLVLTGKLGHQIRILVALDGSERAEHILAPASQLSQLLSAPDQGAIHIVSVICPSDDSDDEESTSESDKQQQGIQRYHQTIRERLLQTQPGVLITTACILHHDSAEALIELVERQEKRTCEEGDYGIIAIATHGRNALQRWIMGGVAERILDTCRFPLLMVRPPE
jgi:nucleotide-binding universal stress UspA family protein